MEYKRAFYYTLKKRVEQKELLIQAVTGPRQVGKTTMVHQLAKEIKIPSIYVTADNISGSPDVWIEQQWEAARLKLKAGGEKEVLLIVDEIQKIRGWSETVKKLWDTDRLNKIKIKVILLGSSGLLLQQGLTESLAGRFELIELPHWSFKEMKECFGITPEEYVWFGAYPGAVPLIGDEQRWKSYIVNSLVETTLSRDILMLTRISKPALMRQVFEMGVYYSSQILSFTKMLGQLQDAGNTVTISHYLNLLDIAGLLTGIPKFYSEKFREKASTPKWQVKNSAFIGALSEMTFNQAQKDLVQWGRIVESAIGAHLVNKSKEGNYKIYYWRHRNEEVDFVLQKGMKLIAIEIKTGKSRLTKGMNTFKNKYNPYKILLVGNDGISWQYFLEMEPSVIFD